MAREPGVGKDPQRDVFSPREDGERDPFAPREPLDPRESRERDRGKPDLDIPAFLRRRKPE